MTKLKYTISVWLVLLLIAALSVPTNAKIDAKTKSDTTSIETDTLVVEIKGGGNVPFFFFWQKGADTTTYKLQLDKIFEVVDNNNNSIYDLDEDTRVANTQLALASLNWEFSKYIVENDSNNIASAIHFNLTSSESKRKSTDENLTLQFRMHINANNDAELKFDVVIEGYTFIDDSAMLIVGFKLITTGNEETTQSDDTVSFGNGYFQSETTAQDDNGKINVGMSTGTEEGNSKIFLAYDHFSGKLIHDPTIGVDNAGALGSGDEATDQNSEMKQLILPGLSRGALVTSTILATLAFLAIPVIIYQFKQKS